MLGRWFGPLRPPISSSSGVTHIHRHDPPTSRDAAPMPMPTKPQTPQTHPHTNTIAPHPHATLSVNVIQPRHATRRREARAGTRRDTESCVPAPPRPPHRHHDYVSYRRTQQGAAQFRAQGTHGGGHGTPGGSLAGTDADSVTVDAIQLRHRLQKLSDSIPRVSSPHMTRRLRQRRSALGKGAPADKQDTHCWLGPRSVA